MEQQTVSFNIENQIVSVVSTDESLLEVIHTIEGLRTYIPKAELSFEGAKKKITFKIKKEHSENIKSVFINKAEFKVLSNEIIFTAGKPRETMDIFYALAEEWREKKGKKDFLLTARPNLEKTEIVVEIPPEETEEFLALAKEFLSKKGITLR